MARRITNGPRPWYPALLHVAACSWLCLSASYWPSPSPHLSVDLAYDAVLHYGWDQQWQHGRDVVYTYGPLSWLVTSKWVSPSTFWWTVLFIEASQVLGYVVLIRTVGRRLPRWCAALLAVLLLTAAQAPQDPHPNLLGVLPMLLLWTTPHRARWTRGHLALLHVSMAVLAVLALAKHTFVVVLLLNTGLLAWRGMRGDRRLLWCIGTGTAVLPIGWTLAGQSFEAVPDYCRASLSIVSGYGPAMGLFPDPAYDRLAMIFAAAAAVAMGAYLLLRYRWSAAADLGVMSTFLFLVFKHAIIRSGPGHTVFGMIFLAVFALMGVILSSTYWRGRGNAAAHSITTGTGASAFLAAMAAMIWLGPRDADAHRLDRVWAAQWSGAPDRAQENINRVLRPGSVKRDHQRAVLDIRNAIPLPSMPGDYDFFGDMPIAAVAHGGDYNPRPVFQSFTAYTPLLADMNTSHFAGDRAPQLVFFLVTTLDQRYPGMADGPCYPLLLSRYRVRSTHQGWSLLLERRDVPLPLSLLPLNDAVLQPDEWVEVPRVSDGAAVWVEMDLTLNLRGKLTSLVYKPPPLTASIEIAGGATMDYRIVPGMARSGFILSPVQSHPLSYRALATGEPPEVNEQNRVMRLALHVGPDAGGVKCMRLPMVVRFFELSF